MTSRRFWRSLCFLFFLFSFSACGEPANENKVVELGNEKITVAEFKEALSREKENQNPDILHQKKMMAIQLV